jgi:hypothetical protein
MSIERPLTETDLNYWLKYLDNKENGPSQELGKVKNAVQQSFKRPRDPDPNMAAKRLKSFQEVKDRFDEVIVFVQWV